MGLFPSVNFQKIAPSVCCHIFGSDKLPGRTGTPLRSSVDDAGPSPRPVTPWQGTQPVTNSCFPTAIDFASTATGFSFRAAPPGAVHDSWVPGAFSARAWARPRPETHTADRPH